MRSRDISNILYSHLQKTYGHQTKQSVDLVWEALTLKVTWHFDHKTNMRLREKSKKLYLHFYKTYVHYTWQGANIE